MTKRLNVEVANFLINKAGMTAEQVSEKIGNDLFVDEDIFIATKKWAFENTASKRQKILWG